jgi:hypothetical protein
VAIHAIADVKLHLGIADTAFDTVLTPIVAAIERAARTYTRYLLEQATVTAEKHSGDGRLFLDLNERPIVSVATLKIGGTTIVAGASSWEVHDAKAGRLYRPSGWDWPSNAGQNNVEVTYDAGYAASSAELAELKLALVEWSASRFRLRNKVEYQTESFQDHSATYYADMPGNTKFVLTSYKRVMS